MKQDKDLAEVAKAILMAREARDDFKKFIAYTLVDPENPHDITKTAFDCQPHHQLKIDLLTKVEKLDKPFFIIIEEPPRHGKTEITARSFIPWFHGRNPYMSVIYATYNDAFSAGIGAEVVGRMQSRRFRDVFPEYAFTTAKPSASRPVSREQGVLLFAGVGGSITGEGGHIILGDDFFKNREEAQSQNERDKRWKWFIEDLLSRMMGDNCSIILFMTRRHEDDIIGRLTDPTNPHFDEELFKKIIRIRLPAICEEDKDVLGRKKGEPLWGARYGLDYLKTRQRLDPLSFEALYQQSPTLKDGEYFQRDDFRFYETLPANLRIYGASDHAVALDKKSDPTCMIIFGVSEENNIYIIDVFWRKAATDVAIKNMVDLMLKYKTVAWYAEDGHIRKSIAPFLKAESNRRGGIFTTNITPSTDKVQRAQSFMALVASNRIYFPKSQWWTQKAIDEFMKFPYGRNDDFVDASSLIGLKFNYLLGSETIIEKEPDETKTFGGFKKWRKKQEQNSNFAAMSAGD